MKKFKVLISGMLLISILSLSVTSCGKRKMVFANTNVNLAELASNIAKEAGKLPEMSTYSSEDKDAKDWFTYLCDLDYSKVDQYYISYSSSGSAEEIFLIKLKNSDDIGFATMALKDRIVNRTSQFELYLPGEVSKLSSAKIISKGNYVGLIICSDLYSAQKTFEAAL